MFKKTTKVENIQQQAFLQLFKLQERFYRYVFKDKIKSEDLP